MNSGERKQRAVLRSRLCQSPELPSRTRRLGRGTPRIPSGSPHRSTLPEAPGKAEAPTRSTFTPYGLSRFGCLASRSAARCQGGQPAPALAQERTERLRFTPFDIAFPRVALNRPATVQTASAFGVSAEAVLCCCAFLNSWRGVMRSWLRFSDKRGVYQRRDQIEIKGKERNSLSLCLLHEEGFPHKVAPASFPSGLAQKQLNGS